MYLFVCLCKSKWGAVSVGVLVPECTPFGVDPPNSQYFCVWVQVACVCVWGVKGGGGEAGPLIRQHDGQHVDMNWLHFLTFLFLSMLLLYLPLRLTSIIQAFLMYRNKEKVIINDQCGYLMRTKVSSSNEGGVAAGFAVLDSLYLSWLIFKGENVKPAHPFVI